MSVTLDLGEWKLMAGETVNGMVRVVAIETPQFHEDAKLSQASFKAEQFMVPAPLWECLVDVIASHDRAREKLREMYASAPDVAMSIVVPALQLFSRRARVRR